MLDRVFCSGSHEARSTWANSLRVESFFFFFLPVSFLWLWELARTPSQRFPVPSTTSLSSRPPIDKFPHFWYLPCCLSLTSGPPVPLETSIIGSMLEYLRSFKSSVPHSISSHRGDAPGSHSRSSFGVLIQISAARVARGQSCNIYDLMRAPMCYLP